MDKQLISAHIGDDEDVIILQFSDESQDEEILYHPAENELLQLEDTRQDLNKGELQIIKNELVRFSIKYLGFKDETILLKAAQNKATNIISEYEEKLGILRHEKKSFLFDILVRELQKN